MFGCRITADEASCKAEIWCLIVNLTCQQTVNTSKNAHMSTPPTHTQTHTVKYCQLQLSSLTLPQFILTHLCPAKNILSPFCVCMCVHMCVCPWSGPLPLVLKLHCMPLLRHFLYFAKKTQTICPSLCLFISLPLPPLPSLLFTNILFFLLTLLDSLIPLYLWAASPSVFSLVFSYCILLIPFFSTPPSATFPLHIYPSALSDSP